MHRIWSDGSWLKAYLAHGCYWHGCTFCDTSLDYVNGYKMIDTQKLYNHLVKQAQKTQTRGIHFVDEAAPPVSLKNFAFVQKNPINNKINKIKTCSATDKKLVIIVFIIRIYNSFTIYAI